MTTRAAEDLLRSADRMRDYWADADKSAKTDLWRALHIDADVLREVLDGGITTPEHADRWRAEARRIDAIRDEHAEMTRRARA